MVIGRPKKDPEEKRAITLTFKVTNAEHLRLSRLAKHRQEELFQATGQHFDMPVAVYLRWLVDVDAQKRGVPLELEEPQGEPRPVHAALVAPASAPVAVPAEPAPKPVKAKTAPKTADLRDELPRYRKRHGLGQRELAAKIGSSQPNLSALESKKRLFSAEPEAAFRALLEAEG